MKDFLTLLPIVIAFMLILFILQRHPESIPCIDQQFGLIVDFLMILVVILILLMALLRK